MSVAMLGRDPFMPRAPRVRGRAFALAVLAHAVLILGLAFGVDWRSEAPTPVTAELWSATPQAAAPRAIEPPAAEVKRVELAPKPVVAEKLPTPPPAPTLPDPQIALERAKKETAKRDRAAEQEALKQQKRDQADHENAALALQKRKADQAKAKISENAEKARKAEQAERAEAVTQAARQAATRDANLKRMAGLAGATGGPADTGAALRSGGPSQGYAGRVAARIKPNILFTEPIDGNPQAVVQVRLAPDGTIVGKRLVQSSGVKAWDDAVMRAIERTDILPLDNGQAPAPFEIGFKPRD